MSNHPNRNADSVDSGSKTRKRPTFKGLTQHKDQYLGFSFFRPIDWQRFDWLDDREGVLFGPSPDDDATLFAVAVRDLGLAIGEEDIPDLKEGFLAGIERLPDVEIESEETWQVGPLIGLEARYAFREDDTRRKRWVRVLYQDTRQITLTAQGATVQDFNYWLPMFFESMMTFQVHATPLRKKPALDTE